MIVKKTKNELIFTINKKSITYSTQQITLNGFSQASLKLMIFNKFSIKPIYIKFESSVMPDEYNRLKKFLDSILNITIEPIFGLTKVVYFPNNLNKELSQRQIFTLHSFQEECLKYIRHNNVRITDVLDLLEKMTKIYQIRSKINAKVFRQKHIAISVPKFGKITSFKMPISIIEFIRELQQMNEFENFNAFLDELLLEHA